VAERGLLLHRQSFSPVNVLRSTDAPFIYMAATNRPKILASSRKQGSALACALLTLISVANVNAAETREEIGSRVICVCPATVLDVP
jgi:hypothetical protein